MVTTLERAVNRPTTQAGKRHVKEREAKLHENDKKCLIVKPPNSSQAVAMIMKDFYALKRSTSQFYTTREVLHPFDDESFLDKLASKFDCSLLLTGVHSKKRPCNLIFARHFDGHILDMVEFKVTEAKLINEFHNSGVTAGIKPCMTFSGELFDTDPSWGRVRNLLIDFFRGETPAKLRLAGLEHLLQFTLLPDGTLKMRSYRVMLKKSGTRVPRVELEEMGPRLDLKMTREKLANDDQFKRACRRPKELKAKKRKNVSHDVFGTRHGQIHMERQNFDQLATKNMKALKKRKLEKTPQPPSSASTPAE